MRYRWLMTIVAMTVMAQAPEEQLARRLDHEAQFQFRFARRDVALRNLQIAEWLAPNANRLIILKRSIINNKKGNSNDSR